jgi:glutaredoxin
LACAYFCISLAKTYGRKNIDLRQGVLTLHSGAREAYTRRKIPFEYVNVLEDDTGLQTMLKLANGRRQVPVIVEAGKVTIGYGGS